MLDREDIDALLIGRLYGELSSADEARLQAYLAGTSAQAQADKRALEDMTSARTAVRESRLLAEQVDPPHSISALLMQEAARRAPKQRSESEGWFARFVRSFAAHPAMAAAATLVFVVAVGGTLYMRNGKQLAEDRVSAREMAAPQMSAPADQSEMRVTTAPAVAQAPGAGSAALGGIDTGMVDQRAQGDGYVVGLQEGGAKGRPDPAKATPRGINVTTPDYQPKELEEESPRKERANVVARDAKEAKKDEAEKFGMVSDDARDPSTSDSLAVAGGGAPAPKTEVDSDKQKAAPKKPAAPATTAPATAPPPPPPADVANESKEQKQHKLIVAAAKSQRCDTATSLALKLEESNPGYYDAEVKNDRDLKGCIQRIDQTVAEKRAKKARPGEAGKKPAKPSKAEPTSTESK